MRTTLAGALLLAFIAAPAFADERGEATFHTFVAAIGAWEGWTASVGTVTSEGADTIVTDFTAKRTAPTVAINIDRMRIRLLAPRPGTGFSAAAAELSGVAIQGDWFNFGAPSLTGKDLSLPDFGDVAFGTRQFFGFRAALYRALLDAAIGDLAVPKMTVELRGPAQEGSAIAYTDVRLGPLRAGVLDRVSAGPVRITSLNKSGTAGIDIASADMQRASFSALARFFSDSTLGTPDGSWSPTIGSVRYAGIAALGDDGSKVAIDEIGFDDLDTRVPSEPLAARLDALVLGIKQDEALETVLETLQAVRVGGIRINGIRVAGPPVDPLDLRLGAIAFSDLGGSGFAIFDISGFHFDAPGTYAATKTLHVAGVAFPDFSQPPELDAFWAEAPVEAREEAVRRLLASIGHVEHFEAGELAVGTSEQDSITVGSLTGDTSGYVGSIPTSTSVEIKGLSIPGALLRPQKGGPELLEALGEDHVAVDLSLQDRWNPEAGTDSLSLALSLNDAAKVQLAYSYSGITEAWLYAAIARAAQAEGEDFDTVLRVLQGLTLDSASARVTDRSLLDRGFAYAAKRQGLAIDGPTYRQQMRGALPFLISAALPAELSKLLIEPLQAFLGGGQVLVVEAVPAVSLPISSIVGTGVKSPIDLLKLLDVEVKAVTGP